MKIVFLDALTVGEVPNISEIKSLGEYTEYPFTYPERRQERLRDVDVVIVNKVVIDREVMNTCPELKLICVAATGTNNIDLICAEEKGIAVKNVTGYSTNSVTQVTFTLIFELLINTRHYNDYILSGRYSKSNIFTYFETPFWEISGKKFGIVGLGTIGKRVALIAEAFGASISYFSASGKSQDVPYQRLDLECLLKESDVVSIHTPLNERTLNLIAAPQLRLMKPSALLVNVGRGGIVNETDLAEAIDSDIIAGAGLDVYTKEPLPEDHPFMMMKNKEKLLLLPHIAWASVEARILLISRIAENIKSFFEK